MVRRFLRSFLSILVICALSFCSASYDSHTIIMDAGSTGTRVYVYKFDHLRPLETMVEVAHMRVNPAMSTFVGNATGLATQLRSLIKFAKFHVNPSDTWQFTNISLKATAGLRTMSENDQIYLMDVSCSVLLKSGFLFDRLHTGVISGEEEALFDVLAVNAAYHSDTLLLRGDISGLESIDKDALVLFGATDMGGSSQQIAFSMKRDNNNINNIVDSVADNNNSQTSSNSDTDDGSCVADWIVHVPHNLVNEVSHYNLQS